MLSLGGEVKLRPRAWPLHGGSVSAVFHMLGNAEEAPPRERRFAAN